MSDGTGDRTGPRAGDVMRRAVYAGYGRLVVETGPVPAPGDREVLVKVEAAGICGTDRSIVAGTHPAEPPVVLGHEYSGSVVDLGPGVLGLEVGDRVTVDPNIMCQRCDDCRRGSPQFCERNTPLGISLPGGFAEYSLVPEANAYKIRDSTSFVQAALVEPLACCVRGMNQADVRLGDVVVVLGLGTIGLLLAQLARLRGAAAVIGVEPLAARRELAGRLGVDHVIDADGPAVAAATDELTGGRGADVVIEASGATPAAQLSLELVRRGGTALWFGCCPEDDVVSVRPFHVNEGEITVRGSNINPFTHATALTLIEHGRIEVAALVSDLATLAGLDTALRSDERPIGKLIVQPGVT